MARQLPTIDDSDTLLLDAFFGGDVRRELARIAADPRSIVKG